MNDIFQYVKRSLSSKYINRWWGYPDLNIRRYFTFEMKCPLSLLICNGNTVPMHLLPMHKCNNDTGLPFHYNVSFISQGNSHYRRNQLIKLVDISPNP